jgi:hypothetical protein
VWSFACLSRGIIRDVSWRPTLATEERAREKIAPMPDIPAHYRAADKLLAFWNTL